MRKVLKWVGIAVAGLVALAIVVAAGIYWQGGREAGRTVTVAFQPIPIPTDSASLARGQHLAASITKCVHCHGENLGGTQMINGMPFMNLWAPNITSGAGGLGGQLSDADWERAIRYGVGPTGRRLVIMPADAYVYLSDADLADVIAYLKSVPPVAGARPAPQFGPIARMLLATGTFPLYTYDQIDVSRRTIPPAPAYGDTLALGRYLTHVGGCISCHGPNLAGGPIPGMPPGTKPAANLTPTGIGQFTEADFVRVLREGTGPGGVPIDTLMPWKLSGTMTDPEIHAVWTYIRSVPPAAFGAR